MPEDNFLEKELVASEGLQKPTLDDDQADLHQLIRTYQWLKEHMIRVIIGLFTLIALISYYAVYSISFKDNIINNIKKIETKIVSLEVKQKKLDDKLIDITYRNAKIEIIEEKLNFNNSLNQIKNDINKLKESTKK